MYFFHIDAKNEKPRDLYKYISSSSFSLFYRKISRYYCPRSIYPCRHTYYQKISFFCLRLDERTKVSTYIGNSFLLRIWGRKKM